MFRLQDNIPSIYLQQSRDFQLICRLYDSVNNGVKYDIDSIINILDPMKVNDTLLNLMCTKVGFFTNREYDANTLRHIIKSFPYAVKYKGSKHGINIAVSAILKAEGVISTEPLDSIIYIDSSTFNITIYTRAAIQNTHALDDFLKYILPVGYTYTLGVYVDRAESMLIGTADNVTLMRSPTVSLSQVRGSDRILDSESSNSFDFKNEIEDRYIGSINALEIIGTDNFTSSNTYAQDRNSTTRDAIDESNNGNVIIKESKELE